MILEQNQLDRLVSADKQAVEISRILKAFPGEVLFTLNVGENTDVIETFLSKAGVRYDKIKKGDVIEYQKIH